VLLAIWLLPLLLRFAPVDVPRLDEVSINLRAVFFALMVTAVTGIVVGLLPARRAARTDLIEGLQLTRSGTQGRRDRAARSLLVVLQTALTVACLGAAGLVIQSLLNVLRIDPGFTSDRVLTVDVSLSPGRYGSLDARAEFARQALQRLEAVPGVTSVGIVNKPPLTGISMNSVLVLEGTEQAAIPFVERPQGDVRSVDTGYFRTLSIPLVRGRLFQEVETRPVAVVSVATANRAWPGQDPIGKRFRLTARPRTLVEVIGVVGDVHNMGLEVTASSSVYLPYSQIVLNGPSFVVRTGTDPAAATAAVRAAISEIDHDVPIDAVRTMRGVVSESVAARSFQATLLTLFGVIAVALSGIGVFGVMSYTVAQRSKELAIRLALGATKGALQRLIVGHAVRLVGTGVALGAPLAVAAGFILRNTLFGVRPEDPRVLLGSAALIMLVAILAGWIPAYRVTKVSPVATLRAD
jgi:putative ABC transport system permease protein